MPPIAHLDVSRTFTNSINPMDRQDDPAPTSEEHRRNWLELPPDVFLQIFQKIGAVEIMMRAQFVCRWWRDLSMHTQLWRRIDMTGFADLFCEIDGEAMARAAVDRSNGEMEEFCAENLGSDLLLRYIANRTNLFRCLRLISCHDISDEGLTEVANKFPQLEELEVSLCSFSEEVFKYVGQACPQLKCFRLNAKWFYRPRIRSDEEAFAIANNMKELRELQLFGNRITNKGLHAILDNCLHLESLDIRHCFNLKMDNSLQNKCARIRYLRLPSDSVADYRFITEVDGDGTLILITSLGIQRLA